MKTSMINGVIQIQEESSCPNVQNRMVAEYFICYIDIKIISNTLYWFIIHILKLQKCSPEICQFCRSGSQSTGKTAF